MICGGLKKKQASLLCFPVKTFGGTIRAVGATIAVL